LKSERIGLINDFAGRAPLALHKGRDVGPHRVIPGVWVRSLPSIVVIRVSNKHKEWQSMYPMFPQSPVARCRRLRPTSRSRPRWCPLMVHHGPRHASGSSEATASRTQRCSPAAIRLKYTRLRRESRPCPPGRCHVIGHGKFSVVSLIIIFNSFHNSAEGFAGFSRMISQQLCWLKGRRRRVVAR